MRKRMREMLTRLGIVLALVAGGSELWAQSSIWATAYYAGWMQGYNNTGYLPAQNIDYSAMTHIVHFALVPRADGSLDDASNSVTAYNANALVTRAHAAGRQVIICVGGWATDGSFRSATSPANRATFISNLVNLMTSRGYDGIDVDWEPLAASDGPQYVAFITELRTALNAISPRPLLMAATAWAPSVFAQLTNQFDQINIMSYDLSGAWPGWVTWHNAATRDGGFRFPSSGGLVPSADGMVNNFVAAGVPAPKLGIGIDFYGYIWTGGSGTPTGGATEPRQGWTSAPSVQSNVPYYTIMNTHYQPQYYRWDAQAEASYLSIDNPGSSNDMFISFDDQMTILSKVLYARTRGIGGVIIWELGGGYRASLPAGQRDSLLQALRNALGGTTGVTGSASVPASYQLSQNFPDPFNPSTAIRYGLPEDAYVSVQVFNSLGQLVTSLVQQNQSAGQHEVRFNASNLSSGVYFYRLTATGNPGNRASSFTETRKMVLMK